MLVGLEGPMVTSLLSPPVELDLLGFSSLTNHFFSSKSLSFF